jgi:glucans biosynthesis protein
LYEIPARNEYNDNIVAFWRPKEALQPKREYTYTYRLHWTGSEPSAPEIGRFVRSRQGATDGRRLFVLDAVGEAFKKLPPDAQVRGEVSADRGKILDVVTQPNPHTEGWRLSFQLDPEKATVVELRARFVRDKDALSESWVYRWTP